MTRNHGSLFCWFGTLLLLSGIVSTCNAQQSDRPNVLMIAIDDQNDWIGCLKGHPLAQTPTIDKLAASGTLFSNAHCQAPLCNSSRTSVLTGLRPSTTGVYALLPNHWAIEALIDHRTLPQSLRDAGYTTATTGKIYHAPPRDADLRKREFDVWGPAASVGAKPPKRLIPDTPPHNNPLMDWGVFDHRDEDKGDYQITDWAVNYLEQRKSESQPFFLSVGYFLPHVPCYVTSKWYDRFPDSDAVLPPIIDADRGDTPHFSWYLHWSLPEPRLAWLKQNNQWRNLCRSYLASTTFVDSQIARLMDCLEQQGLADNTLIVVWSDHGWHLGEKEISGKNTLWECSTRVPLIFAGPGVTKGQVCGSPAELLDIYPTLVELLKLKGAENLEGHSLVAQLRDAEATRTEPAITTHNRGNHSVRSKTHRLIHYADGSEELYDLRTDPHEWNNQIENKSNLATVSTLRSFLPPINAPMVPNSAQRTLQYDEETDVAIWEGTPIHREDPIPPQ